MYNKKNLELKPNEWPTNCEICGEDIEFGLLNVRGLCRPCGKEIWKELDKYEAKNPSYTLEEMTKYETKIRETLQAKLRGEK